jgi:glyoxylase-like metal-dependent hydrolase (beta-lactamase superfamily II)
MVPSRYAQKVGAIDVLVISDGVLPIPARTIAHNIEPAVRAAWLEHEFLSPEMLEWPLNVVVVRSGGRTILIDAGIGMDPGLNLPQAGRLIRRLEAAGIDLASVTDVVLTHTQWTTLAAAHRRSEGPAASGSADPRRNRRAQVLGVA